MIHNCLIKLNNLSRRIRGLIFVTVFAIIGTILLLVSHADSPTTYASVNADKGSLSIGTCAVPDSSDSDGMSVKFGGCGSGSGSLAVHVSGNHLVDADGNTLVLHGVDISSTESVCSQNWNNNTNTDPFGGIPLGSESTYTAIAGWGINAIRIPLNEDCWLNINGVGIGGTAYQNAIEQEVQLANEAGLYVLLDLHWSAPGTINLNTSDGQNLAPDEDHSVTFWQQVAAAFKSYPAAIFDLYNEPVQNYLNIIGSGGVTPSAWSCWLNGCYASNYLSNGSNDTAANGTTTPNLPAGATWETAGVNQLITTIRATGATQPVMANGIDWGNDDTGWLANAPTDPDHQLIAGAHIYPAQCDGNDTTCDGGNAPLSTRLANWNATYPAIEAVYPVLIGETGDTSTAPVSFLPTFLPYAKAAGWSYFLWTWDAWGNPSSVILSSTSSYSNPTPNAGEGTCYKDWLAMDTTGPCPY